MKRNRLLCMILFLLIPFIGKADEGMWLINRLNKELEKKMQAAGLKLPARVIYDEEALSLSDAVVALDFSCTGSMISDQGLLITNHHCAYSDIYAISTPEKDYLEEGFWALTMKEEIPVKGRSFYFLKKVIDVSEEFASLAAAETKAGKNAGSRRISSLIEKKYREQTGLDASVSSMWRGEKHYLYLYEIYRDVRLVGAPPVSVAAFGGDIDNWEWPQQKGDFALYRIYTAPDGKPAEYAPENVPLKPAKVLQVSTKGVKPGDFTMIIGYPGKTGRYSSSFATERKIRINNPIQCEIQGGRMEILRRWMDKSPAHRLAYADHFFSISNVQELLDGERKCLVEYGVAEMKRKEEAELSAWIREDPERTARWGNLLDNMKRLYEKTDPIQEQKTYYREANLRGSQYFMLSTRVKNILSATDRKKVKGIRLDNSPWTSKIYRLYKEMFVETERELLKHTTGQYLRYMQPKYLGEFVLGLHLDSRERLESVMDSLIDNSFLKDSLTFRKFSATPHSREEILKDPLMQFYNSYRSALINKEMRDAELGEEERCTREGKRDGIQGRWNTALLEREYTNALYEMRASKEMEQYPDANSTMRITYGNVGPLKISDGETRPAFSNTRDILAKHDPDRYEYTLKPSYLNLLKRHTPRKGMNVNFLSNNDITGGNSGSPVLNAKGELVGLAFDGNKESLSSDVYFHPEYGKCVNVDIRYVLWILDRYAHMDRILKEMKIR